MDIFRKLGMKNIGIGGLKCPCCNSFHGKNKKKLNRMARARLSVDTLKEIKYTNIE